jgi:surface protein
MKHMFNGASSFNSDISNWNVSSVKEMGQMFFYASSFNQNLCPWGPKVPASLYSFGGPYHIFYHSGCPNKDQPTGPTGPWCKATCP